VPKTVGLPLQKLTKDYVAAFIKREKWIYFLLCGCLYHTWIGHFFQFDNSLLLADETAISNLEFIIFRHPPPTPFSNTRFTVLHVKWVGNIVLASKIKKLQPENLGGASAPLSLRHLRLWLLAFLNFHNVSPCFLRCNNSYAYWL